MKGRTGRLVGRFSLGFVLAALMLCLGASTSIGAVTIGQTGGPNLICVSNVDRLQPTVAAGTAYVVPATVPNWVVTSWSTQALGGNVTDPMGMKVYRPLGGLDYRVVGHEGPHALNPGVLNTFPASVAVKPGDVLGLTIPPASNPGCAFTAPGDQFLSRDGNLADGDQGTFAPSNAGFRLNISAVISPTNTFTLGDVDRNKKKGTATITVNAPNPGQLVLAGNGLKTASTAGARSAATVTAPGDVKLKIKAKGKKKRKLNENGKVKVTPSITFTPTGGDPNTQKRKLKLKKRL